MRAWSTTRKGFNHIVRKHDGMRMSLTNSAQRIQPFILNIVFMSKHVCKIGFNVVAFVVNSN